MNAYHPVIKTLKAKFFRLATKEGGCRLRDPILTKELDIVQETIRGLEKEAESFIPPPQQTICHLSL